MILSTKIFIFIGIFISIGLLFTAIYYFYNNATKHEDSVEDLDNEYITFLNKLNAKNKVGLERVYYENK